jgi:hypothetical protein
MRVISAQFREKNALVCLLSAVLDPTPWLIGIGDSNPNQPCFYLSDLSSPIFSFYMLFI